MHWSGVHVWPVKEELACLLFVYLCPCACICARVYVCTCVLGVYTQSAHCWCVSVGSVHSFVCIDVHFLNVNMYMCVLCE